MAMNNASGDGVDQLPMNNDSKRLLVVEGNTRERQQDAVSIDVRTSSSVYEEVIKSHFPDVLTTIVDGVDGVAAVPGGMSLADYDGLVIGDSGLRCGDDTPDVREQIELLREFARLGRPILGSCWGFQVAVVAAGGAVRPSPNGREIIVARKLRLTSAGQTHAFFADKPHVFDAPCTHCDEISELPEGAEVLCSNDHSSVQAATIPLESSIVWGVQYHPEFDVQHLSDMLRLHGVSTIEDGFFTDLQDRDDYIAKLARLAADPSRKSLAWQLGIGRDILDDRVRNTEIINWVESQVLAS